MKNQNILIHVITAVILIFCICPGIALSQSVEECTVCHEDMSLESVNGRKMGINVKAYKSSIHGDFSCVDCHTQTGDFEDVPHFQVYQRVNCGDCHSDYSESYKESFHGVAQSHGVDNAPDCVKCHGIKGNAHNIGRLDLRNAENSCKQCHQKEAKNYDSGVHTIAAAKGLNSPGCISCHPTHSKALPPSTGAVNKLCEDCHANAMMQVRKGEHKEAVKDMGGVMACASCHDVHSTHKPHLDKGIIEACKKCHPGYEEKFKGSVHEKMLHDEKMNCLSCHRTHQLTDAHEKEQFGCGACHDKVEEDYRQSAHRLARLNGDYHSASCTGCHASHHILPPTDKGSPVNRENIPETCGVCHTDVAVVTSEYVRLPISLPRYQESIHSFSKDSVHSNSVCTDCHGVHLLLNATSPRSMIYKLNLSSTCGRCHPEESAEYNNSIHGKALELGIEDSPSCTDCHDEHLILSVKDPKSSVSSGKIAKHCAHCHEDPEMAARYGLPPEVIESYNDSYHGWASGRGGELAAKCVDCHESHDIRSPADPAGSIHKNNVVGTCGKCHQNSNEEFAASYTHILARTKKLPHDWAREIYIILIIVVLGGMALHNMIIFAHEMKINFEKHRKERTIIRMSKSQRIQHLILILSFAGLAITGFALRFSDSLWVEFLSNMGLTEVVRRLLHRILAVVLMLASFYHMWYMLFTKEGRYSTMKMLPRFSDLTEAFGNIAYHLGLRKEHVVFDKYDYTEKAEYWALVWGTALMSITGIVLWFPEIATSFFPSWIVRVSETVHFYEAILAVSAIIIWHWFYVIFLTKEYPMSWTWITGDISEEIWEEHHGREKLTSLSKPKSDTESKKQD